MWLKYNILSNRNKSIVICLVTSISNKRSFWKSFTCISHGYFDILDLSERKYQFYVQMSIQYLKSRRNRMHWLLQVQLHTHKALKVSSIKLIRMETVFFDLLPGNIITHRDLDNRVSLADINDATLPLSIFLSFYWV